MFSSLCDPCNGCPECDPNLAYEQSYDFAEMDDIKSCRCCGKDSSVRYWRRNPQSRWPKKTFADYGRSVEFKWSDILVGPGQA